LVSRLERASLDAVARHVANVAFVLKAPRKKTARVSFLRAETVSAAP
jgi:hypothetical protein